MISTGGTLVKASEAVLERGATSVITCATHGIFAADAAQKLIDSPISEVVVTNTIPVADEIRGNKIKVLSVASLLAGRDAAHLGEPLDLGVVQRTRGVRTRTPMRRCRRVDHRTGGGERPCRVFARDAARY